MKKVTILILVVLFVLLSATFAFAQSWVYEQQGVINPKGAVQMLIDIPNEWVTYVGKAKAGASGALACWQVMRVYSTETTIQIQFYDGTTDYTCVWNDRATATYK